MTRDTPTLLAASELRDMSLRPTAVRAAGITVIHPQLRDLILPLARGHVLYPHGAAVAEQRWSEDGHSAAAEGGDGDFDMRENDDEGGEHAQPWATGAGTTLPAPPAASRNTEARTLFKLSFTPTCLTTSGAVLACGGSKGELYLTDLPQGYGGGRGALSRAVPVKPFSLSLTLPSHSINNAITILPAWPTGWLQRQAEFKRTYIGYGRRGRDESEDEDEDGDDDAMLSSEEAEDAAEPEDGDVWIEDDDAAYPAVATYPNTLPFGHAPRIPGRGDRRWSSPRSQGPQYVTSRSGTAGDVRSPSSLSSASLRRAPARPDEPRILVSNNDQTVKMFALKYNTGKARAEPQPYDTPAISALRRTVDRSDAMARYQRAYEVLAGGAASASTSRSIGSSLPPPRTLFGSSTLGYDAIALNEGILTQDLGRRSTPGSGHLAHVHGHGRAHRGAGSGDPTTHEEVSLDETRYPGESLSAYRSRNPTVDMPSGRRHEGSFGESSAPRGLREMREGREREREGEELRRLGRIGRTKFKLAVNHSSLSPDLQTMVTVGDSTDVFLYEVIDGGREFRKIGVYNAATDSGFSTAWSKDGRKFAVASQDGQVTVWDHRSSRPLALFYSSPSDSPRVSWDEYDQRPHILDPVSSSSGREAARVVKFSPEGSDRDLLVFSEEHSNIHIIDARTFDTHVVVPVPYDPPAPATPAPRRAPRVGVENGQWGISGVAFDPAGEYLYAGTERTLVEWDLRRCGGGEGGAWSMA